MKKNFIILFIFVLINISSHAGEPNVLKCKKDCGTPDINNEFSFQARLSMGSEKFGGNVTFIEDDIIITSAHVLGINSERKICCSSEKTKKTADDWKRFKKEMFVVEGNSWQGKQKIIAKVLDISGRTTGMPEGGGYDLLVAHVDRDCKQCQKNKDIIIVPIPLANKLPEIGTPAQHICITDGKKAGKGIIWRAENLNGLIYGGETTQCSRQIVKHDGVNNPPMLFDGCSGSPVIFKECGNNVVHGLHGNGIGDDKYMYEMLQLVQTQKEWIQSEIFKWTGRTDMLDSCADTGRRSFMAGEKFDILQNGCSKKKIKENDGFVPCDLVNLEKAVGFPF